MKVLPKGSVNTQGQYDNYVAQTSFCVCHVRTFYYLLGNTERQKLPSSLQHRAAIDLFWLTNCRQ